MNSLNKSKENLFRYYSLLGKYKSFEAIHSLQTQDLTKEQKTKLQSLIIATDNYLHNVFQSYDFDANDKDFLVSKDELSEIFKTMIRGK